MKAIILAAGRSSRLYPLTLETPKGLLDVGGQKPLLRLVGQLEKAGVDDIVVAVGHKKEKIQEALGGRVRYHEFPEYETKNYLHTLWSARHELDSECLILYADLMFDDEVLKKMIESPHHVSLAIDSGEVRP